MPDAQRRPGRFDIELPIDIKMDLSTHAAVTKNIGTGGVFVATEHLAKVGERVALNLTVPGWPGPIAADGEVRWIRKTASPEHSERPAGMGVQFVGLTMGASLVIQEFLQTCEAGERTHGLPKSP